LDRQGGVLTSERMRSECPSAQAAEDMRTAGTTHDDPDLNPTYVLDGPSDG
jgi:hypothetical protein